MNKVMFDTQDQSPMRRFAESFFARFGAQVYSDEREMIVDLPAELVEIFDQPRLYLVFADRQADGEVSAGEELLVYGSRIFDRMLALLAARGEVAHFCLPHRFPDGDEDPFSPELKLANSRLIDRQTWRDDTPFYLFHFRVIFMSDERQETVCSVLLDETGVNRADLLADLIDSSVFQPLATPFPVEPGLLARLYDLAGSLVTGQIDGQAADLERAAQFRLEKALLRLTTFYRRLAAEVNSGDAAKDETIRAELTSELNGKIADELERHQLRVTIKPISYAIAVMPMAFFELKLATRRTEQPLQITRSLYSGRLMPLSCQHCAETVDTLAVCDHGHVAHPSCLSTCCRCGRDLCHACDIGPCALCEAAVCVNCVAPCAHCGRRVCAEHVRPCAACGRPTCSGCIRQCSICGMAQCPDDQCGQADGPVGPCHTCLRAQVSEDIPGEAIPPLSNRHRYRWQRAENEMFIVYLGRATLKGGWVLVTDHQGRVLQERPVGFFKRLLGKWT